VTAKVYNLDLTEKFSKTATADIAPDSSTRIFAIPDIDKLSSVYFVRLSLQDSAGKPVSTNFYWLSPQQDVSDWTASNGRYTPILTYADLTGLEKLPEAKIKVTSRTERRGAEEIAHVLVENPSPGLAFCVHLRVTTGADGAELAPVLWEDNYFALMPGEKREITATYPRRPPGGGKSSVKVDGWNLAPASE
jgi:exo-1,4-beta-D-glucosaminidase